MWFLHRLETHSKTIGNFRKGNAQHLRGVCRQFIFPCHQPRLFGVELIVIDGFKFEAANARNCEYCGRRRNSQTEQFGAKIQEYPEELETNDEQEAEVLSPSAEVLRGKSEILRERKRKLRALGHQMNLSGKSRVPLTYPDSQPAPSRCRAAKPAATGHGTDFAIKVNLTVDSKLMPILEHGVTADPPDQRHLSVMALRARDPFLGGGITRRRWPTWASMIANRSILVPRRGPRRTCPSLAPRSIASSVTSKKRICLMSPRGGTRRALTTGI